MGAIFTNLDSAGCIAVLIDATVKGIVILTLAGIVTLSMRRASAAFRHQVWVLALCGVVVMPALSAVLPGWKILPDTMKISPHGATPATNQRRWHRR